jgi:hypothetical protein
MYKTPIMLPSRRDFERVVIDVLVNVELFEFLEGLLVREVLRNAFAFEIWYKMCAAYDLIKMHHLSARISSSKCASN